MRLKILLSIFLGLILVVFVTATYQFGHASGELYALKETILSPIEAPVEKEGLTQEEVIQFIGKINEYRKDHSLQELQLNEDLIVSAGVSAHALTTKERTWSHNGYKQYISSYYHNWITIGENLARDYRNFDEVLEAWKYSPTHNDILLGNFCDAGLGKSYSFWVLHVGCEN